MPDALPYGFVHNIDHIQFQLSSYRELQSSSMQVALQTANFITSLSVAVANTVFLEVIVLSHFSFSLSPEGVIVCHLPPSAAAMSSRAQ